MAKNGSPTAKRPHRKLPARISHDCEFDKRRPVYDFVSKHSGLDDKRIKDKDGNCNEDNVVTEEPGMTPVWKTRRKTAAAKKMLCSTWTIIGKQSGSFKNKSVRHFFRARHPCSACAPPFPPFASVFRSRGKSVAPVIPRAFNVTAPFDKPNLIALRQFLDVALKSN
ncbi:MAG: hypothetical protein LBM04_04515 [Opitutaceae bacterium]|jgi:hypothetical protein|nr:hypothetical protein [Opitutaceae bacterium]